MAPPRSRHRRALAITIRELRARSLMSQEDLSFAAGRSRGFVDDLEAGRRAISFEGVAAIAEALGVTMAELGALVDARLAEQ